MRIRFWNLRRLRCNSFRARREHTTSRLHTSRRRSLDTRGQVHTEQHHHQPQRHRANQRTRRTNATTRNAHQRCSQQQRHTQQRQQPRTIKRRQLKLPPSGTAMRHTGHHSGTEFREIDRDLSGHRPCRRLWILQQQHLTHWQPASINPQLTRTRHTRIRLRRHRRSLRIQLMRSSNLLRHRRLKRRTIQHKPVFRYQPAIHRVGTNSDHITRRTQIRHEITGRSNTRHRRTRLNPLTRTTTLRRDPVNHADTNRVTTTANTVRLQTRHLHLSCHRTEISHTLQPHRRWLRHLARSLNRRHRRQRLGQLTSKTIRPLGTGTVPRRHQRTRINRARRALSECQHTSAHKRHQRTSQNHARTNSEMTHHNTPCRYKCVDYARRKATTPNRNVTSGDKSPK